MSTPINASHLAPHIDAFLTQESVQSLHDHFAAKLAKQLLSSHVANKEVTLVTTPEHIIKVLTALRDDKRGQFSQLIDVCGVDWLGIKASTERFEVVYHLLSLARNQRIRVKVVLPEGTPANPPTVPSVVELFSSAGWYERETYDMFGVVFENHPDLRRLLTDYGFEGHPLRKDFPLVGYVETYFDAQQNRVAYKPVDLPQDFRRFDSVSEWQGITGNAHLADADNVFDSGDFK